VVFAAKKSRLSPRRGGEAKIEKQIPHDDQKMNSLAVQLLEMSMKFVASTSCPLAGTWCCPLQDSEVNLNRSRHARPGLTAIPQLGPNLHREMLCRFSR
jgi:hypothetical protein